MDWGVACLGAWLPGASLPNTRVPRLATRAATGGEIREAAAAVRSVSSAHSFAGRCPAGMAWSRTEQPWQAPPKGQARGEASAKGHAGDDFTAGWTASWPNSWPAVVGERPASSESVDLEESPSSRCMGENRGWGSRAWVGTRVEAGRRRYRGAPVTMSCDLPRSVDRGRGVRMHGDRSRVGPLNRQVGAHGPARSGHCVLSRGTAERRTLNVQRPTFNCGEVENCTLPVAVGGERPHPPLGCALGP